MNIEDFIQEGSDNAIPRWKLEMMTGKKDRFNRKKIAKYNETADIPIINAKDGYYKATNPEEIVDVARREYFRAKTIEKNAQRLFNIADQMRDNLEVRARL